MDGPAKLIVVVADKAYERVLNELLARHREAGFHAVDPRIVTDPFHDSSRNLTELLRPYLREYEHALVFRDLAGSGFETEGARRLEAELEAQMRTHGWLHKKHAAIVTEPEIEDWLRLPSASLLALLQARAKRRRDQVAAFHGVLERLVHLHGGRDPRGKAHQPKEVFEGLVRHYGIPPANALLGFLAKSEPLDGCLSPSFNRLLQVLRDWFPLHSE